MKLSLLIFCLLCLSFHDSIGQNGSYYNQTEFGIVYGKGVDNWDGNSESRIDFSMITFHGVQITRHHAVGFSIGLDQYESISLIPIALGWRGFLGKENRPQLMGGFDIGGGSAILEGKESTEWSESWYEGGVMLSPSIGVKFPGKKGKTALTMTIAYKRQELSYFEGFLDSDLTPRPFVSSDLPPGFNSINETAFLYHSLVARVGFIF